jgi:hypothetical protein
MNGCLRLAGSPIDWMTDWLDDWLDALLNE